jgi:hypothetical protein
LILGKKLHIATQDKNMNYRKVSFLMKFIRGQVGKSNKSTMLVRILNLSYGCELLENSSRDQDVSLNGELMMLGPHIWDSIHSDFYIGS